MLDFLFLFLFCEKKNIRHDYKIYSVNFSFMKNNRSGLFFFCKKLEVEFRNYFFLKLYELSFVGEFYEIQVELVVVFESHFYIIPSHMR